MGKAGKKEHMKGIVKGFDVLEEAFSIGSVLQDKCAGQQAFLEYTLGK